VIRYLTEAKLDHWHGTSHDFVQHWLAQVTLAKTLTKGRHKLKRDREWIGVDEFASERELFHLFKNAFAIAPVLNKVSPVITIKKYTSDGEKYLVVRKLTFAEYHTAIASACIELDHAHHRYPSGHLDVATHHMPYKFFDVSTDVLDT